jgi:hypothetical protein
MSTLAKRLKRNIARNQLLDRELDYLPETINRDDVRLLARRYGPLRKRSLIGKMSSGATGFFFRYSAPFIGMIIGAEYRAARALQPVMGEEQRFGDSLRAFLGESLAKKVDDTNKSLQIAGTLLAATPEIILWALYGAVAGIAAYYTLKWALLLGLGQRRKKALSKRIADMGG